ncbi:MAG: hypothetical protein WC069_00030 [Candidatus Shapirobacteria bacterium]
MKKYIILSLFLLLLSNNKIFAQSSLGLSAIPPRLEIIILPGQTITKTIKVRNESKVEKVISTTIKDFIVVDDSGTPVQVDNKDVSNRWSASTWIQVSNDKVKLKPGETKNLSLTVIAPDNALPGGHYAMVLHSPNNESVLSQTGAVIQTNVGTLVYITIPGDINESANITNFFAPSFSEYGPISFKATIANLSDIHISPIVAINVSNFLGIKTATLPVSTLNIFPYTSREFSTTLNRQLMFGKFKAQLSAMYGTNGKIASSTIFFWVIPYKLIVTLIAIVTIIILIIKLKKTNNKESSQPKIVELEQELEMLKKKYKDRK